MRFFMIAAVMELHHACSHSHHLSYPPVAAPPASGASRPGCAGGPRRLDDLRLRTRRRRHSDFTALSPRAGLAGHLERPRHLDRGPRATRRRASRLNRRPLTPQRSWPATPIMGPPWPGLVRVWVGLLVGILVMVGPRVPAVWPASVRPRTRVHDAVSPRLDDRDLEDDPPSALMRRTTAARGRPPATLEGHAAVTPTQRWPSRYLLRPQLLTRRAPLPMGRDLRASIQGGERGSPVVAPLLPTRAPWLCGSAPQESRLRRGGDIPGAVDDGCGHPSRCRRRVVSGPEADADTRDSQNPRQPPGMVGTPLSGPPPPREAARASRCRGPARRVRPCACEGYG